MANDPEGGNKKRKAAMGEGSSSLLSPPHPPPATPFMCISYWQSESPPSQAPANRPPTTPPPASLPLQLPSTLPPPMPETLSVPPPPPPIPEGWLQAVPAPRPDVKGSGRGDSESTPSFLGQSIYTRFMALLHVLEAGFARKVLAVLRAFGLCMRDVTSDIKELQPYLGNMCQVVGCTYETLLNDPNVIQHLQGLGVPATRKQKRTLEPGVCDAFIQELYNGGAPALCLILSAGQKRICGNDLFTKRYLIKDEHGHNLSAPELLERVIVSEDLDELVGCLLGMLFASGCGASTGEASTIVQCHDNQSRSESHLALARARFLVADAGEYFCLVLSLQRLPTHNKYLVTYSQATHTQVLGALGVPISPLPPYTPTMPGRQQHREANVTSPPSFFAAEAVATDPGYIPI